MGTLCFCEILRAKLAKLEEERPSKSAVLFGALCLFLLSLRAERGNPKKAKLKNQNEEGFYILICHFDFLSLIFDIVRDLVL